ncbi:hypothetical protein HU720_07090 [Pseudomonas sp. SWRI51]|uniref:hypothetical protein n=1 Tax=Pseudomonas TaxID=286 RepID=UPI001647C589|nr:hypothetical protein [Pseudomonas sp. SWRI51]MBC3411065.1 hypothetical protein [Pseudomonas sp. SWRI51]
MTDPVTYFWIAVSVIILLVDLWAIISEFRSDKADVTKAMWALMLLALPVVGLAIWAAMVGLTRAGGGGAMGLLWFESEAEWE